MAFKLIVKGDGGPMSPLMMWIGLGSHAQENGEILLTGDAMCASEIEGYVNKLKRKLESIVQQAKQQEKRARGILPKSN